MSDIIKAAWLIETKNAEIERLKRELSAANDAAAEGEMFRFAVRDVVKSINRTVTEDFYEAVDKIISLLGKDAE